MPLIHAEVGVEVVRNGIPRHLSAHSCLEALDVSLRRTRGELESGVVGRLDGRPGRHRRSSRGRQARAALGSVELVPLLHGSKQVSCDSCGTVFFRLLASAYWRSCTLRSPNHVRYISVRIYELHLYIRMTTCEDPKDFVCECLADLIDVFKIKHNRAESIDT